MEAVSLERKAQRNGFGSATSLSAFFADPLVQGFTRNKNVAPIPQMADLMHPDHFIHPRFAAAKQYTNLGDGQEHRAFWASASGVHDVC